MSNQARTTRSIGFVVNPIAGMGGRVGLKGTDGKVDEAIARGATPRAPDRAERTLRALTSANGSIRLLTAGGIMGEDAAQAVGFEPEVVTTVTEPTNTADTIDAARVFCERQVDLILFVGGDGTAADIAGVLDCVAHPPPMVGAPAGVKMFSSVFAATPEDAGRLAATFDEVEGREVMDIDEEAYREGTVEARLLHVVEVPIGPAIQSGKQLAGGDITSLTAGVIDDIDPETTYVLGAGSTLMSIKRGLGFDGSPLGVDVWKDGEVVALDADEETLLEVVEPPSVAIVSPIGGQGFILGRGNQQLSPAVLEQCDLQVIASRQKLDEIDVLRVDTDDPEFDDELRGWIKVRVDRHERRMMKIV